MAVWSTISEPVPGGAETVASHSAIARRCRHPFEAGRARLLTLGRWRALWLSLLCALPLAAAPNADHAAWDRLLQQHVLVLRDGRATQVDYAGFADSRSELASYLEHLSQFTHAQFAHWSEAEQLAFLINAYNAWTVELVLTRYPELDSIKDLGSLFRSPWAKAFIPLLGRTRSLDDIEHRLIRQGPYREPRIHFALNCAAVGCPALRPAAYEGHELASQLDRATHLFLSDRTRNRFADGVLYISSIFKWYREDFESGWDGFDALGQFLASYADALELSPAAARAVAAGTVPIEFLDYDWRLNHAP